MQLEPSANPAIRWDEVAHRVSVPNSCLPGVFMAAVFLFYHYFDIILTAFFPPHASAKVTVTVAVLYRLVHATLLGVSR